MNEPKGQGTVTSPNSPITFFLHSKFPTHNQIQPRTEQKSVKEKDLQITE